MIKPDTKLYGIQPEMVICHISAYYVFESLGYGCVITSGVGKEHKDKSLHPVGYALDYRTKHVKTHQEKINILNQLKIALPCCDIILEQEGGDQEHIHCEFDPKDDNIYQMDKAIYKKTGQWPRRK